MSAQRATSRAAESIAADSDSIATRAHSIANALEGTDLWTLGLLSVRVVTTYKDPSLLTFYLSVSMERVFTSAYSAFIHSSCYFGTGSADTWSRTSLSNPDYDSYT